MLLDISGCFEDPDPNYNRVPVDRQYSFKENSPLFHYLKARRPNSIWNLGYYRLNYILRILIAEIKESGLFDKRRPHIVVCDNPLQEALNRRWFLLNHLRDIVKQQLDLHPKVHLRGKTIYKLTYRVEIDAIAALLDF
jgi:hypothetical protein